MANVQGDKYSCQNLVTDEIKDYHVTRLREFRYDERYADPPRDIALRDREEWYFLLMILRDPLSSMILQNSMILP